MNNKTRRLTVAALRSAARSLASNYVQAGDRYDKYLEMKYELRNEEGDEFSERAANRKGYLRNQAVTQWDNFGSYMVESWIGAVASRDAKAVKIIASFLKQISQRPLTEKQIGYMQSLSRKFSRKSPVKIKPSPHDEAAQWLWPRYLSSSSDKAKLAEIGINPLKGQIFYVLGEYLPPLPEQEQSTTPAPTKKSDAGPQLAVLDELLANRPNTFIESIKKQLASGKVLTDAQKKAVRQTLYRSRMKPSADLFR